MENNYLEVLMKTLDDLSEKHREERTKFNEELGEPAATITLYEDFQYGFWKSDGGVVKIRKYKNGYARGSTQFISNEEIEAILKARNAK